MWWFSISCTLSDLKFMLCMGLYVCVLRACFHIHWLVVVPFVLFSVYECILQWIFLLNNNSPLHA